jgi:hypothetical protein
MDLTPSSSSDVPMEQPIDIQLEQTGEYKQDILIDKRKLKQIQNEGFSLSTYTEFQASKLEKLGIKPRKPHLFYGVNLQERALDVSLNSNTVRIPLLALKDLVEKLQRIKPEI